MFTALLATILAVATKHEAAVLNSTEAPTAFLNDTHRVTIEEKHLAEAASAAADQAVQKLEKVRDEAWRNARGSLAIASDPPIRSSAVFDMLTGVTSKFAQLEASINEAKAKRDHARRIADLAGTAWDAHEGRALKRLREREATLRLNEAREAVAQAEATEEESLRELKLEKARSV